MSHQQLSLSSLDAAISFPGEDFAVQPFELHNAQTCTMLNYFVQKDDLPPPLHVLGATDGMMDSERTLYCR